MYLALGSAVADVLDISKVRLCDNGVVSVNLPQSSQTVGTFASRSTHPKYIALAQEFIRHAFNRPTFTIRNSLLFKTKSEVMHVIRDSGHPGLLQETVSCGHTLQSTTMQPHCGTCSQCIDRRFSGIVAGMENHDSPGRYKVDIFADPIPDGAPRVYVEGYIRYAHELSKLRTADEFAEAYPEIFDCATDGNVDQTISELWDMLNRHQTGVNKVLEDLIRKNATSIVAGDFVKGGLIEMIVGRANSRDLREAFARRLGSHIIEGLPLAFRRKKPQNEGDVQDVGDAIFVTAKERLIREGPQLPFASISTKPDFSEDGLFVEFKFVKERNRLNGIVTEMTSRVTIYRAQNMSVLFVVYDPENFIPNDSQFVSDFEQYPGIWVVLCR